MKMCQPFYCQYELEAQFRCAGSDGFINWINNTPQVKRTANVLWSDSDESFDFQILDSTLAVETAIKSRATAGHSARMTADPNWTAHWSTIF
jgi:uncharacterized protein